MINREKLRAASDSEEDFSRLLRMAEIVSDAIPEPLDSTTGIAVIDILANRRIQLADGTVLNEGINLAQDIWVPDAATIVSALSDLDHDWQWWRSEYTHSRKDGGYDAVLDAVYTALSASPNIAKIGR